MEVSARLKQKMRSAAHRELAIDCGWALFAFASAVAMIAAGGLGVEHPGQRDFDALAVAMAAGLSLPLLARRRAPVAVFAVVMSVLVVTALLAYPVDIVVGPIVALFTLARAAGREVRAPVAIALAFASFAALVAAVAIAYEEFPGTEAAFIGLLWLALWLAGYGSRLKGEHIAWLEERAERAEADAEGMRALAAAEERTRIARDLHDSAGHAINVILVEAGAARLLRERDPERAEQALATIEEVAREQIDEIDRLVHALRAEDPDVDDPDCGDGRVSSGWSTGAEAGAALIERMRATGLEIEVRKLGEFRHLGPSVGRSTYRILQEALTNAQRHGTGSAELELRFGDDALELAIENPTANGQPGPERHGLAGMRERAELLGGSLEAEQADDSFRLRVVLPYDPAFEPRRQHPPPRIFEPVGDAQPR